MYHDELRAENIFGQICKSYHINLMPEVCKADFDIQTVLGNFNDDFVPPRDGFPYGHFLFMVFVVVVFNICCFVYCQKKKKRQNEERIHSQVQMQVEKYFRLDSNESAF